MSSISDRIEGIESKIRQLADQLAAMRAEKARLAEENAHLRKDLAHSHQIVQRVRTQLSKHKIELVAQEEASSSDVWQQQIDDHIKEIDTYIDSLSNKQA